MIEHNLDWAHRVAQYYDETTELYLANTGPVLQAGLLVANGQVLAPAQSCVEFAHRAGIVNGATILDAGCGVAGPAVAIAESLSGVRIRGVTLSSRQVAIANKIIVEHELSRRVGVEQADFHCMNSADCEFDAAIFMESFGHSYDVLMLVAEMHRVLRPGGLLYIKDVFANNPATDIQDDDLAAFNRQFVYRTQNLSSLASVLSDAGFSIIRAGSIESIVSYSTFKDSVYRLIGGNVVLTKFGERHDTIFTDLPIYFGEILAQKQARQAGKQIAAGGP